MMVLSKLIAIGRHDGSVSWLLWEGTMVLSVDCYKKARWFGQS